MPEIRNSSESEMKAKAVFESYSTLRAIERSIGKDLPLVGAHCLEARNLLLQAFPELQRVETVFCMTEEEIKAPR